jgi:MOSC domain-containing protein YiiM
MYLLSVNIGNSRQLQMPKKVDVTGIFKEAVAGSVTVGLLGLADDAVMDKKHHGGPDQAVYLYGQEDYSWWSAELGVELAPGTFGENLTVAGLECSDLHIGDRLRIGAVTVELTAPRIPCGTLAARMGDPGFVKRFRHAERPGVYCRVITPGAVQAGDPVTLEPYTGETLTVRTMYQQYYRNDLTEAEVRRQLAAPIAIRARQELEEKLALL